ARAWRRAPFTKEVKWPVRSTIVTSHAWRIVAEKFTPLLLGTLQATELYREGESSNSAKRVPHRTADEKHSGEATLIGGINLTFTPLGASCPSLHFTAF